MRRALSFCYYCKRFFCHDCLVESGNVYCCGAPECVKAKNAIYGQWFCDRCLAITTDESAGSDVLWNGIGTRLIGRESPCPVCRSVEATAWFVLLFAELKRLARYRVVWLEDGGVFGRSRYISRRIRDTKTKTA